MARVNLARRAEIALAKRARTRALILEAARECYAAAENAPVTVDMVMQAAGLAKGTFYVHFRDMTGLDVEIGASLIEEIDEHLQAARTAVSDPVTRLATATTVLLHYLAEVPARARLIVRAFASIPDVGESMRVRLLEDVAAAQAAGSLAIACNELAARVIAAIALQAMTDLGQGQIDASAVPDFVRAILRAIGCTPSNAERRAAEASRNAERFAQQLAAAAED